MNGYIKLHRKFQRWEWYKDKNTKILFLHLLLNARYDDGIYEGKPISKGQLITSRRILAFETGLTQREVRTSLGKLISTGEINTKPSKRNTIITIKNWELYQGESQAATNKTTNKTTNTKKREVIGNTGKNRASVQKVTNRTTKRVTNISTNQRPSSDQASNKKEKKEKKNNNNIYNPPIIPPTGGEGGTATGVGSVIPTMQESGSRKLTTKKPGNVNSTKPFATTGDIEPMLEGFSEEFKSCYLDFVEMRKSIKKPMTVRAVKISLNELAKLSEKDETKAIAIVEQSIFNNWQSFYTLKNTGERGRGKKVSIADIL